MIIVKKYITSETDRDLVAYFEEKEVARIFYSILLNNRRTLIDAEEEIEDIILKRYPDHLIEFDY